MTVVVHVNERPNESSFRFLPARISLNGAWHIDGPECVVAQLRAATARRVNYCSFSA